LGGDLGRARRGRRHRDQSAGRGLEKGRADASGRVHADAAARPRPRPHPGYVDSPRELHALFAEVDCFLYRFPEGLTSRRGSVLACLQSGKPVIVNTPRQAGEFDHRSYRRAIADGSLMLLANNADARAYADASRAQKARPRARCRQSLISAGATPPPLSRPRSIRSP
jgi:hypothetical protein